MAVPMTSCMSLPMMATSVQSQSPILTLVGYLAWQTWVFNYYYLFSVLQHSA